MALSGGAVRTTNGSKSAAGQDDDQQRMEMRWKVEVSMEASAVLVFDS